MMPIVVVFAVVSLASLGLLRVNAPHLVRGKRALAFLVAAALALVGLFVLRRGDVVLAWPLQILVLTWVVATIVVVVTGVPVAVARALASLVVRVRRRPRSIAAVGAPANPGRRQMLAAVLPVAALATGAKGSVGGLASFQLTKFDVEIADLPKALDGFRIGHITDVHVGPFLQIEDLLRAVTMLDDEGVDLQVMTGDLLDDAALADACMDAMGTTKARHGMLCVWGNHEKWRGEEQVLAAYARAKAKGVVRLLVDEDTVLEHDGAALRVVGVDWPTKGKQRRLASSDRAIAMDRSADKAFARARPEDTTLCLSHHPDFFSRAADHGAALTLAGHTHGGQVALLGVPLFGFAFEHMLGRYRRAGARGESQLYVGAGTGHWLPWRLGVPAEVTVLTLRRARGPSTTSA